MTGNGHVTPGPGARIIPLMPGVARPAGAGASSFAPRSSR